MVEDLRAARSRGRNTAGIPAGLVRSPEELVRIPEGFVHSHWAADIQSDIQEAACIPAAERSLLEASLRRVVVVVRAGEPSSVALRGLPRPAAVAVVGVAFGQTRPCSGAARTTRSRMRGRRVRGRAAPSGAARGGLA